MAAPAAPASRDAAQGGANAAVPGTAARYVEVGASRLFVQTTGSGPPLVFLHGGLSSFEASFAAQKAYFSGTRTVVGIDQRGHGRSPDNDAAFSYVQMADDTAQVIRSLGAGPVDIVGHSDGGNVGLLVALRHPELVRRLVISGANVRGDFGGTMAYLRLLLSPAARFGAGLGPELRDAYARISPDGASHWPIVVAKTKDLWSTRVVISSQDLQAIGIPVLVMAGDRDVIPLEHTVGIYRALPKAQLCILPGSGHETMRDRAEAFNRAVDAFLAAPQVQGLSR
jgi:pimeloyl-ACP methyl ester carboxylesterase